MHFFIAEVGLALLAQLTAVYADTGFSLAADTYCVTDFAPGGSSSQNECYSGTAVVPAGSWNCNTLQNAPASVWTDADGSFHVHGNHDLTFCGVNQLDMYRGCDDCANFDVYIAGGDGTKVGYCYPTGAQKDSCYLPPFSDDIWGEYIYCDLWGPGLISSQACGEGLASRQRGCRSEV
jgi:hypothetical protein